MEAVAPHQAVPAGQHGQYPSAHTRRPSLVGEAEPAGHLRRGVLYLGRFRRISVLAIIERRSLTSQNLVVFISYLYFDVIHLSAFDAGLRLSTIFFSGTVAAVRLRVALEDVAEAAGGSVTDDILRATARSDLRRMRHLFVSGR